MDILLLPYYNEKDKKKYLRDYLFLYAKKQILERKKQKIAKKKTGEKKQEVS